MRGSGPVDRAARALLARARSAPATTAPRGAASCARRSALRAVAAWRRGDAAPPAFPSPAARLDRALLTAPSSSSTTPASRRGFAASATPGPAASSDAAAIAADDDHGAATTTASPGAAAAAALARFAAVPSDQGTGRDLTLDVFTVSGARTGETVTLPGRVFDVPLRVDVAHRVVIWQRNKRRAGTHHAKTRAQVKGTTRKARPQKGGGRARVGDLRAPQMRGGGKAHGPVQRSHATGLQRKVRRLGLKVALSAKAAEGRVVIIDSTHEGCEPKTRWLDAALDALLGTESLAAGERQHSALVAEIPPSANEGGLAGRRRDVRSADMVPSVESRVKRASKNLPHVQVMHQFGLNVYDILKHRSLVITKDALEALVERVDRPIKR